MPNYLYRALPSPAPRKCTLPAPKRPHWSYANSPTPAPRKWHARPRLNPRTCAAPLVSTA